jgi:hypothetical protein
MALGFHPNMTICYLPFQKIIALVIYATVLTFELLTHLPVSVHICDYAIPRDCMCGCKFETTSHLPSLIWSSIYMLKLFSFFFSPALLPLFFTIRHHINFWGMSINDYLYYLFLLS